MSTLIRKFYFEHESYQSMAKYYGAKGFGLLYSYKIRE